MVVNGPGPSNDLDHLQQQPSDSRALPWLANERLLLLLGAPRSGTSWVAKVFDSHPQVLYRHESDISLRAVGLPFVFDRREIPGHLADARAYLAALLEVRTVKAVGSRPVFPKEYDNRLLGPIRRALVTGLRIAEIAKPLRPLAGRIAVPDLLSGTARDNIHLVLKSVSSGTRARLFGEALPGCRVIFLIRHPGGQVTSMLRGAKLGKFELGHSPIDLLRSEAGRRYGMSPERYGSLPIFDQLVWNWVLFNEKVIEDLGDLPTARIVRHQELAIEPVRQFSELFAFAGLSWNRQTDEFVRRSTTTNRGTDYYNVWRNSAETVDAWRKQVSAEELGRFRAIIRDTVIGRRWPDFLE